MSLEITRTEGGGERHLQLYKDIEREVLPQSIDKNTESNFSQQFFAATHKRRISKLITFGMVIIALIMTGIGLEYIPLKQLESYRPTTLLALGKKEAVRQANALSDIMNYDKCVGQKGVVVQEEPRYCVISNVRYYQNTDISTPIADADSDLSKPLNATSMNKVLLAQNIQALRKGDIQYSGFASEKFQYAGSMTLRNLSLIEESKKQYITQTSKGETPFSTEVLKEFLFAGAIQEPNVLIDTVNESELYVQTFKEFAVTTSVLRNSGDSIEKLYLVALITNNNEAILLVQQLNTPLAEAVNKGYQQMCVENESEESKKNCIAEKVFKDKSIQEKFKADLNDTFKYFALTA